MKISFYSCNVKPVQRKQIYFNTKKYFLSIDFQNIRWRFQLWNSIVKYGSFGPIRYGIHDYIPF